MQGARTAVDLGADGIVLSNHGGRQLDRAVAPLHVLPAVRAAVGPEPTILLDGGVRSGLDVAAAVSLGADACLIGRPYLYGLMAGGTMGVVRVLDLFRDQMVRAMRLLGTRSIDELTPALLFDRSPFETFDADLAR